MKLSKITSYLPILGMLLAIGVFVYAIVTKRDVSVFGNSATLPNITTTPNQTNSKNIVPQDSISNVKETRTVNMGTGDYIQGDKNIDVSKGDYIQGNKSKE